MKFAAHKGVIQSYAHATIHVMLYALRYLHLLNRYPDPLQGTPLVKMAMKGLKRLQGGSVQKVAATPGLILEVFKELNLDNWDGLTSSYSGAEKLCERVWIRTPSSACGWRT